jgi:hypothetical protein
MTTIAWDNRYVAADSLQGSTSYNSHEPANKLRRDGDKVYAITGYFAWFEAWVEWHKAGADPATAPSCRISGSDHGCFLVFEGGRCFQYSYDLPYADEQFAPCAFGSGWKYAVGAMVHGASAKDAVEVAIIVDPGSRGPVQVIDLLQLQECAA